MTRIVHRTAALLRELSRRSESAGVNDLARAVGISGATAYRLLSSLANEGLVRQDPRDSKYQLGHAVIPLAANYLSRANLGSDCIPIMRDLAESTGENANLGVLSGEVVCYVHQVEGSNLLRFGRDIGPVVPVHCSSLGKMFLAYMDDESRNHLLEGLKLEKRTEKTMVDLESLTNDLLKIRERGYALDIGENIINLVGLAVPIWNLHGSLIAGLSLMGPTIRMDKERREYLIPQLKIAGEAISRLSGWTFHAVT